MVAIISLILGLAIGLAHKTSAAPTPVSPPGGNFQGDMTYYGTGLGACGIYSSDSQPVVALSHTLYDQYNVGTNPNNNPLCGKWIQVNYGGHSENLQVVDRCPGCVYDAIDVSPSAFSSLANQALGRVVVDWHFL